MKQFNLSVIALVLFSLVSCNTETIPYTFEKVGESFVINYEYNDVMLKIQSNNTYLTKDVYFVQDDIFIHSSVCDKTCQNLDVIFAAIYYYGYDTIFQNLSSTYIAKTDNGTSFYFYNNGTAIEGLYHYRDYHKEVEITLYKQGGKTEKKVYVM